MASEEQSQVMAQFQLPQYPEFMPIEDPSVASKWEDWLNGFAAMMAAMQVRDSARKFNLLNHYIGSTTRKLLKKLDNNGVDNTDYEKASKALNDYFSPKMNRVYLMNTVQQLKQQVGESMDNFHMRVKEKMTLLELSQLSPDAILID